MDSTVEALGLDELEAQAIPVPGIPRVFAHSNSGTADSGVVEGAVQPPVDFNSPGDHCFDMAVCCSCYRVGIQSGA